MEDYFTQGVVLPYFDKFLKYIFYLFDSTFCEGRKVKVKTSAYCSNYMAMFAERPSAGAGNSLIADPWWMEGHRYLSVCLLVSPPACTRVGVWRGSGRACVGVEIAGLG